MLPIKTFKNEATFASELITSAARDKENVDGFENCLKNLRINHKNVHWKPCIFYARHSLPRSRHVK